jgi:Ca-activated chloride channel family protein
MLRLASPDYLLLLLLVPLLAVGFWLAARNRAGLLARFGNRVLLRRLTPEHSSAKRWMKAALTLAALALVVLGLANPQIGTRLQEVKQEGVDIFIALDVSMSMRAEDIRPNRLEKAKFEIRNLIGRLAGDRLGLIVFAGEAYVQFPLTSDYSAANLFLDVIDVDAVPTPGTSIGTAIRRAMESLDFSEPSTKVLVIISDGENTEGDADAAAREAAAKGVLIYCIGLGSPGGAPIPLLDGAGRQVDFKRDRNGQVVVTRLDEGALERIVAAGKGKYYRGTNTQDELEAIYNDINALQKREFGVKQFTDYEDRFQPILLAAFLLLLFDALLSETRSPWAGRLNVLGTPEEEAKR